MTILEAIKSGKRFRRSGFYDFKFGHWHAPCGPIFSTADILADDWEIEEQKIEVTREQFKSTLKRALGRGIWHFQENLFCEEILKEFGFK